MIVGSSFFQKGFLVLLGVYVVHYFVYSHMGIPLHHNIIMRMLHDLRINAHSFRHTHAMQLISVRAKPVAVAARLGHADAAITQNLYTHNTEEMKQEIVCLFDEIVRK